MGVVNTDYTFTATDTITSSKMNKIIDDTVFTNDAIIGTTLEVESGKLKIRSGGITSKEMGTGSVLPAATTFENKLLPAGAVMAFARSSAPSGWLQANGSSVSTSTYADLFAAIGYTYGGSGSTFKLPDLRGYFVRGYGTNSDGATSGSFGAKQADAFKAHTHGFVDGRAYLVPSNTAGNGREYGEGAVDTLVNFDAGSGTETRPKNIAMLYCIKT